MLHNRKSYLKTVRGAIISFLSCERRNTSENQTQIWLSYLVWAVVPRAAFNTNLAVLGVSQLFRLRQSLIWKKI